MTIAEAMHEEGRKEGRIAALRRQLLVRFEFHFVFEEYETRLFAASPRTVRQYRRRVLTANTPAEVFDDWSAIAMPAAEEIRDGGRLQGSIEVLREQLLFKFKLNKLDKCDETLLLAARPEVINRYLERVVLADSLAAVFDRSPLRRR